MKRRHFITAASSTALASASFGLTTRSLAASTTSPTHQITAGLAQQKLGAEATADTRLWLYNSTSPGPLLRVKQHDRLTIDFVNNLPEETTVHWHGIRIDNQMDGVPNLTQPPVQPKARFTYDFVVPDAGTYWFHAHVKGWKQMAKGLYGPLIVEGVDDPAVDHDFVWMIDDWRLDADWQIDTASLGSMHDWSHQGRLGNWLTVNGVSGLMQAVKPNSRVRLRLINAANARIFSLALNDPAILIATDGAPTRHMPVEQLTLAPAQRADLIIDIGDAGFKLEEISARRPLPAGTLRPDAALGMAHTAKTTLKAPVLAPVPALNTARRIAVHMQGGAMGNLAEAMLDGEMLPLRDLALNHKKLWAFNQEVGSHAMWLAEAERNQLIALDVFNDTAWPHAMHLHGHHFWVTSPTGEPLHHGKRDTHLMQPGERASLVFIADNPGLWLFHCHMMEHHAAGMGAVIAVL